MIYTITIKFIPSNALYGLIGMKEYEIEENFLKALLVTLGFMALFTLLIFIPLIGPVLALTFGPYIAGYRGARYYSGSTSQRDVSG